VLTKLGGPGYLYPGHPKPILFSFLSHRVPGFCFGAAQVLIFVASTWLKVMGTIPPSRLSQLEFLDLTACVMGYPSTKATHFGIL